MKESYLMEKTTIRALFLTYEFEMPDFQREFVWNKEKQWNLIESLINEYPIGVMTLFKSGMKFIIVDGLQRYNTIRNYLRNPKSILNFKDYYDLIRENIANFSIKNEIPEKRLKSSIKEWYNGLESNDNKIYKFENLNLLAVALKNHSNGKITEDFTVFQELRDVLIKNLDITNRELAFIQYRGNEDELSDLFTKINQKAVSLTTYEILHSLWYKNILYNEKKEKYLDAFISLKNSLDEFDGYSVQIKKFNFYMNLAAVDYICKKQVTKKLEKFEEELKNNRLSSILNNQVVFDIFSLLISKTTNKISTSVWQIFKEDGTIKIDEDNIYVFNEAIIETYIKVFDFICHQNAIIYSKYYFLYLFYIEFQSNYILDLNTFNIEKRLNKSHLSIELIQYIEEKQWFKDKNRQLKFFVSKIKDLERFDFSSNLLMFLKTKEQPLENEDEE